MNLTDMQHSHTEVFRSNDRSGFPIRQKAHARMLMLQRFWRKQECTGLTSICRAPRLEGWELRISYHLTLWTRRIAYDSHARKHLSKISTKKKKINDSVFLTPAREARECAKHMGLKSTHTRTRTPACTSYPFHQPHPFSTFTEAATDRCKVLSKRESHISMELYVEVNPNKLCMKW